MSTEWDEPIVNISDVVTGTTQLAAEELRVGDVVFDIFGGEHVVESVRLYRHRVAFKRDDQPDFESFPRDLLITIKRAS